MGVCIFMLKLNVGDEQADAFCGMNQICQLSGSLVWTYRCTYVCKVINCKLPSPFDLDTFSMSFAEINLYIHCKMGHMCHYNDF